MTARRNSDCPSCHGPIRRGDTITKQGRYYVCAACADGGREPTYKQQHGRCEDAPCCGCCGETGYGYATLYTAY
jgi:hypothetical protein